MGDAASSRRRQAWKLLALSFAPPVLAQALSVVPEAPTPRITSITIQAARLPSPVTAWDAGADPAGLAQTSYSIDSAAWSALGARRVEDLAGLVPGLQADVASAGLSSAVKLRGFAVTRLHFNGQLDVQRLFWRDPATVERVEVLAGPAGLSHGIASCCWRVTARSRRPHCRNATATCWARSARPTAEEACLRAQPPARPAAPLHSRGRAPGARGLGRPRGAGLASRLRRRCGSPVPASALRCA